MGGPPGYDLSKIDLPWPSLLLPFRASDAAQTGGTNNVSEAWNYGAETNITGTSAHRAIDFDLPLGAPVYAMAPGWAAYTYQSYLLDKQYKGKRVGLGLGLWLMTLHSLPGSNVYWWGKYGHLGSVAPGIRYLRPHRDHDGDWHEPSRGRDNIYVAERKLAWRFTYIETGDLLGHVGDTGVEWGYRDEFDPDTGTVNPRDRDRYPAWDSAHLHLEIYRRVRGNTRLPRPWRNTARISVDPFGHYGVVDREKGTSPYDGYVLGANFLWRTDNSGHPLYAAM